MKLASAVSVLLTCLLWFVALYLLISLLLAPALAQFNGTNGIFALNHMTFGLMPTLTPIGGSGYTVGDTVTLDCPNSTYFPTQIYPTATVATVSSGVPTSLTLTNPGFATQIPSTGLAGGNNGTCILTQVQTSGSGTGLTVAATFGFNAATSGPSVPPTVITSPAIRLGGSTNDSRTGAMTAGSNLLTLSSVGDFQLGDGIRIEGVGPTYAAGSLASLSVTQTGGTTPNTTAAASWTTASTTIVLVQDCITWLTPGMIIYDVTLSQQIGTYASCATATPILGQSTITLTGTAAFNSSGSADAIQFLETCTYYASVFDGSGGLSAASAATLTNQIVPTADHIVKVSFTPPINHLPGPVWKQCGSNPEVWIKAAQPHFHMSTTPGIGTYTKGAYAWTATGGGCTIEPSGFVVVNLDGKLNASSEDLSVPKGGQGKVGQDTQGSGCTSNPTVAVPVGAGAGTGTITLAMTDTVEDGGYVPNWLPEEIPSTHPTSSTNDWIIGTIGLIAGNVLTICTTGTGTASAPCSPLNATNSITTGSVRHSWTSAIQAAITSANPNNNRTGTANVQLPCGVFEIESNQLTIAKQYVALSGAGPNGAYCTELIDSGIGPMIFINGQLGDSVQNLWLDGSNRLGGINAYAVLSIGGSQLTYQWIRSNNNAGSLSILGANNTYVYNTPQCNNGWADGYSDYDFEGTFTAGMIVPILYNTYCNDPGFKAGDRTGASKHNGYKFNNVQTMYGLQQVAVSDAEGYGWLLTTDTGRGFNAANNDGYFSANQFFNCYGCDSEFAVLDEMHIESCFSSCEFTVILNGSIIGNELNVTPALRQSTAPNVVFHNSRISGAHLGNIVFSGYHDVLLGTEVTTGSVGSIGTYPGIEITQSCQSCIVGLSPIGSFLSPLYQSYPIQFDAPTSQAAGASFTTASNLITMSSTNDGTVNRGMNVYDSTLSQVIGTVQYFEGSTLNMVSNAAHNSSGSSDTLQFLGSGNGACGNSFDGNVNNTILDNSLALDGTLTSRNSTLSNSFCPNSGDTAPGYYLNNPLSFFGVGPLASYANNANLPGISYRATNAGAGSQISDINQSSANNSYARMELATAIANSYALWVLNNGVASPSMTLSTGPGVTNGITISSSALSTAPVAVTAGASSTVKLSPSAQLGTAYSAAGTPLPTCVAGLKGAIAYVSDATGPTYNGTYTSGGAVTVPVFCTGSTWLTH